MSLNAGFQASGPGAMGRWGEGARKNYNFFIYHFSTSFFKVALHETQLSSSWTPAFAGETLSFYNVIPAKAGGKHPFRALFLVHP